MAITYVDRSIGGVDKEAIVVRGTAETEEIILKETLIPKDLAFLDEVDATAGANFNAKLQACVLSNGIKATVVFNSRIKFTVDLQAKAAKNVVAGDVVGAIAALDARVVVLEEAAV